MATAILNLPLKPLAVQAPVGDTAISYDASDLRLLTGAACNRPGRLGPGDSFNINPRAAGANWSIDILPGQVVVAPTGYSQYVPDRYLVSLAARTNIDMSTFNLAPAATRTHKVWIAVDDKTIGGSINGGARIIVTEDTGSGAPNPTAAVYMQLGTVTIAPSQSNIGVANMTTTLQRAARGTQPFNVTFLNTHVGGDGTAGSTPLSYSLDGNVVRFMGSVKPPGIGKFNVGTVYTVANVSNASYRPSYGRYGLCVGDGPGIARVVVGTNGDIVITPYAGNPAGMAFASLDGFSYEIN